MSDNQVSLPTVDPSRLEELRDALAKLDPAGRKRWTLEIYDLVNGADQLRQVIDIKSGRLVRPKKGKDDGSKI